MMIKTWLAAALLITLTGCRSTSGLDVVDGFDVVRYQGVWYEAARLPHRFEKDLSSVSATYSPAEDGKIKVLNKGYHDTQLEWDEIEGVAKLKGDDGEGWLKVSFFKPFYASYKILYLDEEYSRAIVTGPTFGYLWILVRDPAIDTIEIEALVSKAKAFGFDTDKLIMVDQTKNK